MTLLGTNKETGSRRVQRAGFPPMSKAELYRGISDYQCRSNVEPLLRPTVFLMPIRPGSRHGRRY